MGRSGQLARALANAPWPRTVVVHAEGRPALDLYQRDRVAAEVTGGRWSAVVNAAGYTQVDRAEAEPDTAFALNHDGVAALAAACAQAGIPLVHISTDYVFDGTKASPYVEEDSMHPLCVYGASKAAGEMAIRARLESHVILRTSWVFSATGQNFVKTMLRDRTDEQKELRVVNDRHGRPSAAQDIAAAIVGMVTALLDGKPDGFGTFHFANEGATTWHDFAREILDQAARRGCAPGARLTAIPTSDYPTPARRPLNSVLDTERITRVYGIVPRRWEWALSEILDVLVGPIKAREQHEVVR